MKHVIQPDIDDFATSEISTTTTRTEWGESCGRDRTPSDPELHRLISLSGGRFINASGTVINPHSNVSLSSSILGSERATQQATTINGETLYTLAFPTIKEANHEKKGVILSGKSDEDVLEGTAQALSRRITTEIYDSKSHDLHGLNGFQTEIKRHEFPTREFSPTKGSRQELIGAYSQNHHQIHSGELALPPHIHYNWRGVINRVGVIARSGWINFVKHPCKIVWVKLKASLLLETKIF